MIEVKDFSIGFFKRELMGPDSEPEWLTLKNLYLQIRPGHVYGLIGRNGQGKTTLLNCITGLLRPKKKEAGVVYIDGFPVNLRPARLRDNPTLLSVVGFLALLIEGQPDNLVLTCGDVHFVLFHNSCSFV